MNDKLVKAGIAIIGIGGACVARLYGKHMYNKGVVDADEFYKPRMESDYDTIITLTEKLKEQEESQ